VLTAIARSDIKLWFLAIRPLTLPLSATPVLVGAVLALMEKETLNWLLLVATLLAAIAIQVATNLLNDAEDFERGNDTVERRGPPRVTAKGWASAGEVKTAATFSFMVAGLCGLYLVSQGGWPIFWIGVVSILAGIAYSAGPMPISHTPMGELFVFVFFGLFAVVGTFFLQTGGVSPEVLLSGAAMGSYAAAVLHTNNTRDILEDKKAGRRTLAIVICELGRNSDDCDNRRALSFVYALLLLSPYGFLGLQILLLDAFANHVIVWLALISLPGSLMAIRWFFEAQTGSQSNRLLVMTIGLQLMFATLFSFGLLV
jgi:1,4-dihydroxy-2-naphthoate octaprenyltransferase